MFKVMVGFTKGMLTLAKPWWAWVGLLATANMVGLFFLGSWEARVVLAAFVLAAAIQMAIFRVKGFVRLLGIGHIIPWVPMLVWLIPRLREIGTDSALGKWLLAVIVLDGLSLIIDFVDVGRYLMGDRTPSLTMADVESTS